MALLPFILCAAMALLAGYGAMRDRRPGDRVIYGICATASGIAAILSLAAMR